MLTLDCLRNSSRPKKARKRVGRGMGSKTGQTCGRGVKGDKARRGHKFSHGSEGGQLPLYRKLPTRGFVNGRFRSKVFAISLGRLDAICEDGDQVSLEFLQERKIAPRRAPGGLKILSQGEISKKISIEAASFSAQAIEKLELAGIAFECK